MTLEDLIEFGFSAAHFQKLETGQKAVSLYTAHRIAKALGVKVQDLLAFSDTKE